MAFCIVATVQAVALVQYDTQDSPGFRFEGGSGKVSAEPPYSQQAHGQWWTATTLSPIVGIYKALCT